jgi:short-subunit dehydrogenase
LKTVAEEITDRFDVKVDYLATDLSSLTGSQQVFDWCVSNNYTVNILINNAGYGLSGAFEGYSIDENLNMMQLNMNTSVQLCQQFLPMLKQQPKSYILNVASSAAYQAVPGLSLYAATKIFLLNFSRGLRQELKNSSVTVSTICPGATDTDFSSRANVGAKALRTAEKVNMAPQDVAKIAIDGMFKGKAEIVPGIINKLNVFAAWLLPKELLERMAMALYKE